MQELGDKFENQIPSEEKITEMEKEQERFAKLKEEKTQLETKMSYFEAMAMKREEPDYTVKNRLPMMICGIILLVSGAAGGVLSFLLPQVHKFFLPLLAVSEVAAVAGIAYAVYRFFTPDYLEDFEDDFDDDFDDYFEDEDNEEN